MSMKEKGRFGGERHQVGEPYPALEMKMEAS